MTKFFQGGGTIADTISDVPSAIDKMLGNYKKIAMIDKKVNLNVDGYYVKTKIPLDLSFTPKVIILVTKIVSNSYSPGVVYSDVNYSPDTCAMFADYATYIDKKTISKSGFDVYASDTFTGGDLKLETFRVIAIE